jgi:hypothetical protein
MRGTRQAVNGMARRVSHLVNAVMQGIAGRFNTALNGTCAVAVEEYGCFFHESS